MPNDPFFGRLSLNLMGQYLQNNGHVDSIVCIYIYVQQDDTWVFQEWDCNLHLLERQANVHPSY